MFQSMPSSLEPGSFRLRLKTAFTPRSNYASSSSSTSTTSPLSRRDSDEFSPGSLFSGSMFSTASASSRASALSASYRLRQLLMRHHKPSIADLQLQEERKSCGPELDMLEPRPQTMFIMGGIFDVLEGRA